MNDWVVVVDDDAVSQRQMEVCKVLKPSLHGAIECHLDENVDATVCKEVRYFPAFCHVATNECVYGLRTTLEDMESLTTTSQRTTDSKSPQETTQG